MRREINPDDRMIVTWGACLGHILCTAEKGIHRKNLLYVLPGKEKYPNG